MSTETTFIGPLWGSATAPKPNNTFMGAWRATTLSESDDKISVEPRGLADQDLYRDIKSKNLLIHAWDVLNRRGMLAQHQTQPIRKAPHHGSSTFDFLTSLYVVNDPIETRKFLDSNRHVSALLFAALPKVKEAWGNDIKAELHLLEDPDDDSISLNVVIRSQSPNALDALNQFDEIWWFDHVGDAEGLLNFSVQPA